MATFSLEYIKRNPVALGAVVLIGGFVAYTIFTRNSSGAAAAVAGDSGPTAYDVAALQAETQLRQIQSQNETSVLLARENNAAALAAKKIDAATASEDIGAQVKLGLEGLNAQITMDAQQRAVQRAQIDATLQAGLASITAQRDTTLAATQANVQIAGINADVSKFNSLQATEMQRIAGQTTVAVTESGNRVVSQAIRSRERTSMFSSLTGLAGMFLR